MADPGALVGAFNNRECSTLSCEWGATPAFETARGPKARLRTRSPTSPAGARTSRVRRRTAPRASQTPDPPLNTRLYATLSNSRSIAERAKLVNSEVRMGSVRRSSRTIGKWGSVTSNRARDQQRRGRRGWQELALRRVFPRGVSLMLLLMSPL